MNTALSFSPRPAHSAKNAPCEVSNLQCPSNSVFSHVPSNANEHGVEGMSEAIGNKPRNLGGSYWDRSETRTSLHVRLVQHVTEPSKLVAKKVGGSIDTIDSYRQGNIPASWAQLIAYCRAYPAFGLEVLELMGIDVDRDRNAYALFLTLQRQVRGE